MVKIIFYEERNFHGHYYECNSDRDDLQSFFKSCNSIRIESGCWVIYEKPSFKGYQYILTKGEYPEYQRWMGFNDMISSCRTYRTTRGGSYRMKIYERPDFEGQVMEFKDDCPSVYDHFHYHDINSCQVMEGYWAFYEQPNYKGQQYFLRTGEYKRFSDWGALSSSVGSFKRITEF